MISFECPILEPSRQAHLVEGRAQSCLVECCSGLGLTRLTLPIPVDRWIEHPLGIAFGVADLSHLGPDVLGATYVDEREILVSERLLRNEGRFRFTAAHELGHWCLHAKEGAHFTETRTAGPGSPIRIERQADRFAAAFLMPLPTLMPAIVQVAEYFHLDAERCVPLLSEDSAESRWLWQNRFLPRLSKRYKVSLSALVHRFLDVRLHNGRPFIPVSLKRHLLKPGSRPSGQFRVEDGIPIPISPPEIDSP